MKIAFCVSPLLNSHSVRGIGAYTKNLLESLRKLPELKIQEFSDTSEVTDADIIHYPFFDLFRKTLSINKKIPTIVTIHDVIPLAYPTHYPLGIKGSINKFLQKKSLKNISAVITDSQFSKKDIIKYLGIPEDKVFCVPLASASHFYNAFKKTTPLGVDELKSLKMTHLAKRDAFQRTTALAVGIYKITNQEELKNIKQKYSLPEKFALFTGSVNWNKNLLNLSEASLKAGIDLVLIGKSFEDKNNLDHPEMKSFKEFLKLYSNNPKIHILGFIEKEDLVAITNLATVLLLPSFAEGFGLPILEAQICGIPVVTSNLSSMPEVAGSGALLVDPNSVEDISQAINKIINNKEVREELIKEGFENVNRFSWEKTAKGTVEVYAKVSHS